jgi:hypothetical protein
LCSRLCRVKKRRERFGRLSPHDFVVADKELFEEQLVEQAPDSQT